MLNSIIRTPALILTVPLFALIAVSYPAHAEIYKWRDNRGVIQYSDRPPVESFTKVTRDEMVNALQTKDLCAVGPIVKNSPINVASNQNAGAFFSKFFRLSTTSTAPTTSLFKTSGSSGKLIRTSSTSTLTTSSTGTATTLATNTFKNTSFLAGGKNVTVLNFSKKPIKTVTTTPTTTTPTTTPTTGTTTPTTTAPTTTTTTAPTTTAPTTTVEAAPVVVATASPAPTTTTTTNTSANLIQVGLMPAVDISKNITPAVGFANLRIQPSSVTYPPSQGEFRIGCDVSHMSNDDPLVYPNQQGAAHHHTFFGNTSLNYKSDLMTLSSTGNSTCRGGIANRSAYWIPSFIDTATNTPILPNDTGFYYKSGEIDGTLIVAPPKGLRMIAGNSKAATATDAGSSYSCLPGPNSTRTSWPWHKGIPSGADCDAGDILVVAVGFPQCWDGKNLDSPNHKDHMAYPSHRTTAPNFYCPATHPIAIPRITMNVKFNITKPNQTATWRLASDNYANTSPGGYSVHADWVNGWDETVMAGIIKNCINAKRDGHSHLLCDGRTLY